MATATPIAQPQTTPSRVTDRSRQLYPNYKVIVLDDDVNTIPHVSDCLLRYIPGMTPTKAYELTMQIHHEGQAIVWVGPQEQAELYHEQLKQEGLTMAPLEPTT
jgi:ATP-dependent Clp protease adaptor protein ClpS